MSCKTKTPELVVNGVMMLITFETSFHLHIHIHRLGKKRNCMFSCCSGAKVKQSIVKDIDRSKLYENKNEFFTKPLNISSAAFYLPCRHTLYNIGRIDLRTIVFEGVVELERNFLDQLDFVQEIQFGEDAFPNLRFIGDGAFSNCKSLERIQFPHFVTLTTIGDRFMADNNSYTAETLGFEPAVTFPVLAKVGSEFCSGLESLQQLQLLGQTFPKLQSIGKRAFSDCIILRTVNVASAFPSLEVVGGQFCSGCPSLESLDISCAGMFNTAGGIVSFGSGFGAFGKTPRSVRLPFVEMESLSRSKTNSFSLDFPIQRLKELSLPMPSCWAAPLAGKAPTEVLLLLKRWFPEWCTNWDQSKVSPVQCALVCVKKGSVPEMATRDLGIVLLAFSATQALPKPPSAWHPLGHRYDTDANHTIVESIVFHREQTTESWCWSLHYRCSAATRCAVLSVFTGLTHYDSKAQERAIVPSEVAYEICSFIQNL